MSSLTNEEVVKFQREGFLLSPNLRISEAEHGRLKSLVDRVIAENRDCELIKQVLVPKRPGFPEDEGSSVAEDIFQCLLTKSILDPVSQILGPGVFLSSCNIFAKRAKVGGEFPWHQDGHYARVRPRESAVTVWIAIDRSTRENGCVRYLPGSHRRGLIEHFDEVRGSSTIPHTLSGGDFDEGTTVHAVLEPGHYSLHGDLTVHASSPNRSGERRVGINIRFMASSAYYDRSVPVLANQAEQRAAAQRANWPLWLVRGENKNDRNDLTVGHENLAAFDAYAERVRTSS